MVVVVLAAVVWRTCFWDLGLLFGIFGLDGAGDPMRTHPSGVFAAIWDLSLLHVNCSCVWANMQSLPMSSMVGQSCFCGNLDARCETPGMEDMSSGEGISLITSGIFVLVYVSGRTISLVSSIGETVKPEIMRHCSGFEVPWIVVVMSCDGVASSLVILRSSTTLGYTNVWDDWSSRIAIPSMTIPLLGYVSRTGHDRLYDVV